MKVKILKFIDNDTVSVLSMRSRKHVRYGKYRTYGKKYLVDTGNSSITTERALELVVSKPISKNKRWIIFKG